MINARRDAETNWGKNATTLKILNIKIKLVAGPIPFDPRFLFSLSLPYNSLPYNTPSPPYQMISLMSTNIWNHPGLWLVKLLSSTPVVLELTWKVKNWAFCWGNSPRIIMLKSYIVFGVYIIWNVYIYMKYINPLVIVKKRHQLPLLTLCWEPLNVAFTSQWLLSGWGLVPEEIRFS